MELAAAEKRAHRIRVILNVRRVEFRRCDDLNAVDIQAQVVALLHQSDEFGGGWPVPVDDVVVDLRAAQFVVREHADTEGFRSLVFPRCERALFRPGNPGHDEQRLRPVAADPEHGTCEAVVDAIKAHDGFVVLDARPVGGPRRSLVGAAMVVVAALVLPAADGIAVGRDRRGEAVVLKQRVCIVRIEPQLQLRPAGRGGRRGTGAAAAGTRRGRRRSALTAGTGRGRRMRGRSG